MRFQNPVACSILLAASSIAGGCAEQEPTMPPPPIKSAIAEPADNPEPETEPTTVADSERQAFDGLAFMVPPSWEEVPLSQFQMGIISAKFQMPEAGPDVTLTLSRSGGGIEANLDRWRGQFEPSRDEVTEEIAIAGVTATLVDLEGRFSAGFGRDAQNGWRMLGAIVPLEDQGYFIKLTGPVAEVKAVEQEFRDFIKSATKE